MENAEPTTCAKTNSVPSSPAPDTQRLQTPHRKDIRNENEDAIKSPLRTITNMSRLQELLPPTKFADTTSLSTKNALQTKTDTTLLPEHVRRSPARKDNRRPSYSVSSLFDDENEDVFNNEKQPIIPIYDAKQRIETNQEFNELPLPLSLRLKTKNDVDQLRHQVEKAKKDEHAMAEEVGKARKATNELRARLKAKESEAIHVQTRLVEIQKEFISSETVHALKESIQRIKEDVDDNKTILQEFEDIQRDFEEEQAKEEEIDRLMNLIPQKLYELRERKRHLVDNSN